jgi:hypothetical protein
MTHIQTRQAKTIEPQFEDPKAFNETSEVKTPSWFTRNIPEATDEDLVERYREIRPATRLMVETPGPEAYEDYRRKLDEKFAQGQRLYDVPKPTAPAVRRPTLPMRDIHGRRQLYEQEQRAQTQHEPEHQSAVPWFKIISYSLIAIIVGGGSGLGFANRERLSSLLLSATDQAHGVVTTLLAKEVELPKIGNETIIQKKTVQIASLDVNDVRGTLNSMIPLMLSAQAADGGEAVALKIMGLPGDAYLTAGKEITKGNWLVQPSDIAGVKLVVPQFENDQFNMEIAAVEAKTGELAAPIKEINVKVDQPLAAAIQTGDGKQELAANNLAATIAPASAQPSNVGASQGNAAAIPDAMPEASALISKGDGLLNDGDIISARQFYLQANSLGDAKGAYGVGRTYDPQVFAALNVSGLKPDSEKAAQWYQTAVKGGVAAAKTALGTLQASQP